MYADLLGPCLDFVKDIYLIKFMDGYSIYDYVYPIKHKNDSFEVFKTFYPGAP